MQNEDINNGITLADIWKWVKKNIPMVIIAVLVCCMLAVVVQKIIIASNKNDKTITGVVTLTYPGADKGLDPSGAIYNSDDIRSFEVINKTLAKLGITNMEVSEVKNAIKIEAIIPANIKSALEKLQKDGKLTPEALEKFKFIPTSFAIKLNIKGIEGFNEESGITFLDTMMKTYLETFYDKYIVANQFSEIILTSGQIANQEYIESTDILKNQMAKVNNYLNIMKSKDSLFADSYNNTFATLINDLDIISRKADNLVSYILEKGAAKKPEFTKSYLSMQIKNIETMITAKQKTVTETKLFLDSYKNQYPDITVGQGGTVNLPNSPVFDSMFNKLLTYQKEIEALEIQKADYNYWLTKLNAASVPSEQDQAFIAGEISDINEELKSYTKTINNTVKEYRNTNLIQNVSISTSAVAVSNVQTNWMKVLVISVMVGAVVGLASNVIIAKVKAKKVK